MAEMITVQNGVQVRDYRHYDIGCAAESRTYDRLAKCMNCGERHVGRFRFGQEVGVSHRCHHCGTMNLRWGTSEEVRKVLGEDNSNA